MPKCFGALIVFLIGCSVAAAHDFEKGSLAIGHPWTRATPEGANVGVGYLSITNNGKDPDRLIGGSFEGADKVEVHEMSMDGEKMTMRQVQNGLEIKSGETVKFGPGSNHLMFVGLKKAITQGPDIKGSLTFEKAGNVDIEYKVESIGATSSSEADQGDMKMDDGMKMNDH